MRAHPIARGFVTWLLLIAAGPWALAQAPDDEEGDEVAPAPSEDAKPAPEADEGDEGESPARPPPKGKGVIWGVLTDTKLKEPLPEATVTVVGTKVKAITDLDGRFRLELPPGTYAIRFFYELHKAERVQGIVVTAGQLVKVDAQLVPDEKAVDVVEVETEADRASMEGLNLTRKRAAATGDAVGRVEIAKTPDRNAAEAARRVVGANIVDGRFVYVRGLGERYTNALLNGVPLPSPEPDRQAVPLDLFPSLVLEDLTIVKTFTPDTPGDFTGGSVRINTREMPSKLLLSASLGLGFNTRTTFQERLSYQGSSTDWLGFDGGARKLPSSIPDHKIGPNVPRPDGSVPTQAELTGWGRDMNAFMSTEGATSLPNYNLSLVGGDSFDLGEKRRLGTLVALTYGRKFLRRSGEEIRTFGLDGNGELQQKNDIEGETGFDQIGWGAFAGVSYEFNPKHRIGLVGFHSQAGDKEARVFEGFHEERSAIIRETRLRYVSRALTFGQLRGEHELSELDDAKLDWSLFASRAGRDEPDTRGTIYTYDSGLDAYTFEDDALSGSHFFAEQKEKTYGGALDFTQPLLQGDAPASLKLGTLMSFRDREFDARRFRYRQVPGADPNLLLLPPDQLFTDGNIGTALALQEDTRANDSYTADLNVYAVYLMSDTSLSKRLRFVAGQRLEVARQGIESVDPFAPNVGKVSTRLDTTDLLPSASLIFKATDSANLRASVTRTIARPQLRELAPFSFTDYFGGTNVEGNPELDRTLITNGDLRFEYFPTASEVLAFSTFYKHFDGAIEQVLQAQGAVAGIATFDNADSASLIGVELEGRKGLGFLSQSLKDVSLIANLTLARSRVSLDPEKATFVTNPDRPLSNQAPWVVNAMLDYGSQDLGLKARLLYNISGRNIVTVGTNGLPDVYEQPRHSMDAVVAKDLGKHVELKLSATNILNAAHVRTQGETDDGDNVVRKYQDGSTFSLSGTYNY
ncbi:MAG: TonB-dependent receptor [Polyangiaceae bacterium]|nr:TonB-dependent receptor [Polyangiaceae bacterium]